MSDQPPLATPPREHGRRGTLPHVALLDSPPRAGRRRRMAGPLAALGAVSVAWAAAAALDPGDGGPSLCPWRTLTGLDCPFCGATRAAACLAHGQLVAAMDHNALLVLVVVPLALVAWVRWARRAWRGEPSAPVGNRTVAVLMWITVAWWVLRLAVPWLRSTAA